MCVRVCKYILFQLFYGDRDIRLRDDLGAKIPYGYLEPFAGIVCIKTEETAEFL